MLSGLLASKLLYSITLTLLHFLWQGGLTAFALKVALRITSPQKAQLRYAFAALAMLLNLVIPFITFYLIYNANTVLPINVELFTQIVPINNSAFSLFNDDLLSTFTLLSPYIAICWISVCGLLTLKLGLELYQVKNLSHKDTMAPSEALLIQFAKLYKQLNLRFPPQLIISLKTDVPMAIGVFKPIVLIPFSMLSGLTPEQLNMLILHELAHIRRHDYLVNIIQTLIETLFFFHPCSYWVSKQVRKEREYCCDDIAVKHCHDPVAYAHTLADTASVCHKHRHHSIPKMAMAASGGDLKLRVLRLVKNTPSCTSNLYFPKGLALLGMLMVGLSLGIQLYTSLHASQNIEKNSASALISKSAVPTTSIFFDEQDPFGILVKDEYEGQILLAEEQKIQYLERDQIESLSATSEVLASLLQESLTSESNYIPLSEKTFSQEKRLNSKSKNTAFKPLEMIPQESLLTESIMTEIPSLKITEVAIAATQNTQLSNNNVPEKVKSELFEVAKTPLSIEQISFVNEDNIPSAESALLNEDSTTSIQKNNAELIKSIEPRYPAAAQLRGLELDVMVNFTVNTEGKVEGIEFESMSKSHYFKSSIRSAMKKWRFLPAQENGKPVESTMRKIFSFNLLT